MIRKLLEKDYDKIIELGKNYDTEFKPKLISKNEEVFVYVDGEILGFIIVMMLYDTLEITGISVDSRYRRGHIGKELLNFAVNLYKPKNIILEVRQSNSEALAFYKSLGFEIIREIKNYYGNENGYSMERKIENE